MRITIIIASIIVAVGVGVAAYIYQPETLNYTVSVPPAEARATTTLSYGSKPALANHTFFTRVERSFKEEKADFISVDLRAMELTLYKDGTEALTMPVEAKGSRGSWWQTPPGLYKIRTKERDHITSFGGLHMPWSMQFNGNFFIHGWPYFPDGRAVTGDTSAGCIRLSQENAKELFEHVAIGTPVLVYDDLMEDIESNETFISTNMDVSGSRYLVADLSTNQVLIEQGSDKPASASVLSYLLTGLVAVEHYNIESNISVAFDDHRDSAIYKDGRYRVYDLLFAMLRGGVDEAADALARYRGRDVFTKNINDQAYALGMTNTSFKTPDSNADNISTPKDIFTLTKHLYGYRAFLLRIADDDLTSSVYGASRILPKATVAMRDNEEFFGGVVIPPEDGREVRSALGVYEMSFNGSDKTHPIAFIVVDSDEPVTDINRMYTSVKKQFSVRNVGQRKQVAQDASHEGDRRDQNVNEQEASQGAVLNAVKDFLKEN